MEKSKLGLHVLLLAAGAWLLGYFGGYSVMILYAGYVLIAEENAWLKKQVARVLAVMLCFSLLNIVIGLLPNFRDLINSVSRLFNGDYVIWEFVDKLVSLLNEIVYFAKLAIFVLFGLAALKGKEPKLPVIDAFLNKYAV